MIKFLKIRDVKNPKRAFGDAGIDFFVPENTEEFIKAFKEKNPNVRITKDGFVVNPGEAVLIPTGIKSNFTSDIALMGNNKSGVATKKLLICGAQLIDSNYQGEIHAHLINVGIKPQLIEFGAKIVQFVPIKLDSGDFDVTDVVDGFYEKETSRGEGGFGSTGDK